MGIKEFTKYNSTKTGGEKRQEICENLKNLFTQKLTYVLGGRQKTAN